MTLELIIWEAKQRPSSLRSSRRPSTTIDETGCTVTKGFVVPSRSSSFASVDSIAISTTSSHDTPGTPLSPIEDAPPGFSRPSGSLFDAPELQCLKDESRRSLHRPTGSAGSVEFGRRPFKPPIGLRRSTWQQQPSSRWNDEELLKASLARCKSNIGLQVELERSKAAASCSQTTSAFQKSVLLKKTTTKPLGIEKPSHDHPSPGKSKHVKLVSEAEADNAIDSDSDDDDLPGGFVMGIIAAQRLRPNYATRRALSDQRVAAQEQAQVQATEQDPVSTVTFSVSYKNESAIDSDDENGSSPPCKADEHVTAALDLAQLHRSRNSVTAMLEADDSETTKTSTEPEPERPTTLRAKFVPSRLHDGSETPTEIRSFVPQSPMTHKPLRPSRSQPPPSRGVLKKSGSQGHSAPIRGLQRLTVTTRRGSAPFIVSPSKASTPTVQKTDPTVAWVRACEGARVQ